MKTSRKLTDTATRTFHWLFAFCFTGAYLTAESESFRKVHATLGYTLVGLLLFRVVWGLFGPRHVRLGVMFRKLSGFGDWFKSFSQLKNITPLNWRALSGINWTQGQNLFMALAVVALLLMVIPVSISGYATYNDWGGRWLQKIHESVGEFYLFIVFFHLALIVLLSLLRWKNIAMPMITGKGAGPGPDLIRVEHRPVAALLALCVLVWWVSQIFI